MTSLLRALKNCYLATFIVVALIGWHEIRELQGVLHTAHAGEYNNKHSHWTSMSGLGWNEKWKPIC